MATSTVPAAISALVTALDAALDVDVFDGPPLESDFESWVAVGFSPASDAVTSVDGWTQEVRGLGQMGREERFDVVCSLGVSSGDTVMSTVRTSAFSLLASVESALRSNPTLTSTVRFAEFTPGSLLQEQTTAGAAVGIEFRVTCQARI